MTGTGKAQVQRQVGDALLRFLLEPAARLGQAQAEEELLRRALADLPEAVLQGALAGVQALAQFQQRQWLGEVRLHSVDGREYQPAMLLQRARRAIAGAAREDFLQRLQDMAQHAGDGVAGLLWVGGAPGLLFEGGDGAAQAAPQVAGATG